MRIGRRASHWCLLASVALSVPSTVCGPTLATSNLKGVRILTSNTRNPHGLPMKTCPVCLRQFTWRKKWERTWDDVRYCSDACRHQKKYESGSGPQGINAHEHRCAELGK